MRHRSRGVLVIVQVALALVLLVSSGLVIRTFRALTRVNPGFVAPLEVQTFRIAILDTQVKDPERVVRIEEEILRKRETPVFAKDRAYAPGENPLGRYEYVVPGFFKTLGTPLLAGRDNIIRKGQIEGLGKSDIQWQVRFVSSLFSIAV